MPVHPTAPSTDLPLSGKANIQTGPVPDWVVPCPYNSECKAEVGEALTYLLINRQLHSELRQTHIHTAIRLETMQAVQHESQWRLQFEPKTQSVTLHWIKVRRTGLEFDHAHSEKIRLLQREEGLERFVIDGWLTLLLVLDDVRPGDIIDACYTIEDRRRFLGENCSLFWPLPQGFRVGKFQFNVNFPTSRAMGWKSSSTNFEPVETCQNGERRWTWVGENYFAGKPEVQTPDWHISSSWIQVSDCPNWGTVAVAMSGVWKEDSCEDNTVAEIAADISRREAGELERIDAAVKLIQDEYRYLSVNLELGGHVPNPPALVARKRFGDCKDLSFLLVTLLRKLGVSAKPVLVNSTLRKAISGMLPMPELFNHVIVEFQVQGQTRWVDPTIKRQGGGALNRIVPNYGYGLPIDVLSDKLVEPPAISLRSGSYELTETILLDTTGAPSLLSVIVRAEGAHAETLRQQMESIGPDEMARERLQVCTSRFVNAKRLGKLQYRDDRERNEFFLADVFEINGFLAACPEPGYCVVPTPANLPVSVLQLPEKTSRRTPFALPYPCEIAHTIEVQSPSFQPMAGPRSDLLNKYLRFNRRQKSLYGRWSMTVSLATLADAVAPADIEDHRKMIERIWHESLGQLTVPVGVPRPSRKRGFGDLPDRSPIFLKRQSVSPTTAQTPDLHDNKKQVEKDAVKPARDEETALTRSIPRKKPTSRRRTQRPDIVWRLLLGILFASLVFVVLVMVRACGKFR